jgi:hypothetical protein
MCNYSNSHRIFQNVQNQLTVEPIRNLTEWRTGVKAAEV